jgi:8-oxo-dGTP pyrophosphatase MutT (NUDIX family)
MNAFVVHAVSPDLQVRVTREMPPLPPDLDARIEVLWALAAARVEAGGAGRLFNGRVFSIDAIATGLITGHLTEYRRVVAQAEDHALFPALGIRSLSACGVFHCADGVAIGRRPPGAVYQPGMWQLCPAGSVDGGAVAADGTVDYRAALLTELREELGIETAQAGPVTPLCVVEHPGSHVSDLGMSVGAAMDGAAVLAAHRTRGNGEYDPIRIVPIPELPAFISWAGRTLVEPAPVFLASAGLLPQGFSPPTGP